MRNVILLAGLLSVVTIPAAAFAQGRPAGRPAAADPYAPHIAEATRRFGIPEPWIRAVIHIESRSNARAISPKGAMGLMQIMPETWEGLRARYGLGGDPFDPRDNILAGAAYLRELHDRYGNVTAMLAAYNAGPGRYEVSLSGRALPAETRAYVATIAQAIGDGAAVSPVLTASAAPITWTRAPLFVAQPERAPAPVPVPAERPSNDAAAAAIQSAVHDVSAIVPQSGGLFIARTSSEDR